MTTFRTSLLGLAGLTLLSGACADEGATGQGVAEANERTQARIVEVLGAPASGPASAFVELRNDAEGDLLLDAVRLRFSKDDAPPLAPRAVGGNKAAARVAGHGLALVVDSKMSDAEVLRAACDAPIVTTRESLGAAHAAPDDALMGALGLQRTRQCIPVVGVEGLGERLARASSIAILLGDAVLDVAEADFGRAPAGVAFERRGRGDGDFALSPLGATPGARNYFSSDPGELAGARSPIRVYSASPWRVSTTPKEARGADGLPVNPLTTNLAAAIDEARISAAGSFYQVNDPAIVAALVKAKSERSVDVRLTTDAAFAADPSYTPGFKLLSDAQIPVKFDFSDRQTDRAPLSHNKFIVLDNTWLWTGSFNPISDDASRIHADNAVLLRSRALSNVHAKEFDILFGGKFGTLKRSDGVAGASAFVDGAPVSVRFSPGLTDVQSKARALVLSQTSDPVAACAAVNKARTPILEDRYRAVDPCGGPLDLLYGELARATSSIYFVEFGLALDEFGDLVAERSGNGVEVKGVVDATISTAKIPSRIAAAGGDVRATPNSNPDCPAYVSPRTTCPTNPNKVWLHHKFVLVDYGTAHPSVITGSHNMSNSAEQQNDETLVVIHDRAVAEAYYRIFRDVFDHPQALGPKRPSADLPAFAITKVRGSPDPAGAQYVEITNLDTTARPLAGLELWNRDVAVAIDDAHTIAPGGRAVIAFGNIDAAPHVAGVPLVAPATDRARPFIAPTSPLVLRTKDRTWVASYDPTTSSMGIPADAPAPVAGAELTWRIDRAAIDAAVTELVGVNTTPAAPTPTWSPRGAYSDWGDGYSVTPVGLLLMKSAQATWTPNTP